MNESRTEREEGIYLTHHYHHSIYLCEVRTERIIDTPFHLGWLVAAEYIALRTPTELKVSKLTVMGLGSYDDNYDTL